MARSLLPRMLRPYQKDKEGSEIVNRWHAANIKSDAKSKKAKSKDNLASSSGSRRSGFSMPCTDNANWAFLRNVNWG